ncbi:hypothetical protein KW782_00840 [Candidatus Parcubacteria bacterium]|nr:hypothetical protein [Candidatus Parcubacteria bacterium]
MEINLGVIAGLTPSIVLIPFGIKLLKSNTPMNVATWLMWGVLSFVITLSMFAAGNKDIWLSAGFTLGSVFISIILLSKGKWSWGYVETICAVGAAVAMLLRYYSAPKGAVIACIIAMWLASIPLLCDLWKQPDPTTWWVWAIITIAAVVTLITAKAWTIQDRAFPVSSIIFNTLLVVLNLRAVEKPIPAL